jgi:aldose 1-epimerase
MKKHLSYICLAFLLSGCTASPTHELTLSGLNPAHFEKMIDDNKPVKLYTLKNSNGMEVCITNFGARIVSIMVPDKNGEMTDVVLGFDNIEDYIQVPSDFGATIGRYANRIGQGKIEIDGKEIQLPQNNYGHCLHGGPTGWQYQVYEVESVTPNSVKLVMNSPDGDNNFPGNMKAIVTYTLTDEDKLDITYEATCDKPSIINMTNHTYFNLNGNPSKNIENVLLSINADTFTPTDTTFMTTGEILPVEGTPMDFRTPKAVGKDINADYAQTQGALGYDHNWILNTKGDINTPCAVAESPETGIVLTVYTDEPGIQFYSGNFLDGSVTGKNGVVYNKRAGLCLETQHYPDSPNKKDWPSVVLRPGEVYHSHTIFGFSTRK